MGRLSNQRRMGPLVLLAGAGLLVLGVGAAWACTPSFQATAPVGSATPGSSFTVNLTSFGANPAEVRWNSASGPLLATAVGPRATVSVRIPDVAPGWNKVVASTVDDSGIPRTAEVSVKVTGLPGEPPAEVAPGPAGAPGAVPDPAPPVAGAAPASTPGPVAPAPAPPAAGGGQAAPASSVAQAPARIPTATVPSRPVRTTQAPPADGVPAPLTANSDPSDVAPATATEPLAQPQPGLTSDLWAGLSPTSSTQGPADGSAGSHAGGPGLVAGAGLAMLGGLALAAALLAPVARRRSRAPVHRS